MSIYLDAIEGPFKGESFLIKPGYTIGRRKGEVLLEDSKVSGSHAKVESTESEVLVLVDLGSSNGLRIEGEKKPKIHLIPGLIFQLGRSQFKVREVSSDAEGPKVDEPKSWDQILEHRLRVQVEKLSDVNKGTNYFKPALRLEFIRGLQADEVLVLGYGPRLAGSNASDIRLWEPGCPEIGFRLRPNSKHRAEFINMAPGFIKLNDSTMNQKELEEGDLITMGYTTIKVSFVGD